MLNKNCYEVKFTFYRKKIKIFKCRVVMLVYCNRRKNEGKTKIIHKFFTYSGKCNKIYCILKTGRPSLKR